MSQQYISLSLHSEHTVGTFSTKAISIGQVLNIESEITELSASLEMSVCLYHTLFREDPSFYANHFSVTNSLSLSMQDIPALAQTDFPGRNGIFENPFIDNTHICISYSEYGEVYC